MPRVYRTYLVGMVTAVLMVLNTLIFAISGYGATLLKVTLPFAKGQALSGKIADLTIKGWLWVMLRILKSRQAACIDLAALQDLRRDESYLVVANHRSWADVMVMLPLFQDRLPLPKAFAKRELFWFPIIGTAFWTLDFPFVKRYSRRYLQRHPEKRGHDLEITRKACERYRHRYISILIFPEGGRFTEARYLAQASPHRHLLRPKAGGLATALYAMGGKITTMLDITIVYPQNRVTFWDYLCDNLAPVTVLVRKCPVPREFWEMEYAVDPEFKGKFQGWINTVWMEKDELIEQVLKGGGNGI